MFIFVLHLALPALLWRSARGLRVQSDLDSDVAADEAGAVLRQGFGMKFGTVKIAHFTQAQAENPFGDLGKGGPIRDSVHKSFVRGCIIQVAPERELYMREQNVTSEESADGNITTALEALWEAEDRGLGEQAEAERQRIRRLGLELQAARKYCEEDAGKPPAAVTKDCMQEFVAKNRTRSRSWFRRGRGEKDISSPRIHAAQTARELPGWLEKRFEFEHKVQLMTLTSELFFETASGAAELRATLTDSFVHYKDLVKATGFSFTHTQHHCQYVVHKDETLRADELYIERVGMELVRAGTVDGVCQEGDLPCPESTSARHVRKYSWKRFATVFGVTIWPSYAALPWIGFQLGGPALATFLTVVPLPINMIFVVPVAGVAGIPFLGECKCNLNPCEWNQDKSMCTFTTSNASSNEFQWLPYPGTKCMPVEDFDESDPQCAMNACSHEDFQPPHPHEQGIFGKIGGPVGGNDWRNRVTGPRGVFNCLSDDGDRRGDLGRKEVVLLPFLSSEEMPNTPENRNRLYKRLNVTRQW